MLDEVCRTVDRLDAHSVWLSIVDEPGLSLQMEAAGGAASEAAARQPYVPLAAPLPPARVVRTGEPESLATRADVRRFPALIASTWPRWAESPP